MVFLSSNPSISTVADGQPPGTAEAYPVAGCSDDHIADYLGRRFDPAVLPRPFVRDNHYLQLDGQYAVRPTRFWVSINKRATEILGPGADPSRNYAMTEIVHCKSTGERGVTEAAPTCTGHYLDAIFRLTAAPVVVVVGKQAHAMLKLRYQNLPEPPYIQAQRTRRHDTGLCLYLAPGKPESCKENHRSLRFGVHREAQGSTCIKAGPGQLMPHCTASGIAFPVQQRDALFCRDGVMTWWAAKLIFGQWSASHLSRMAIQHSPNMPLSGLRCAGLSADAAFGPFHRARLSVQVRSRPCRIAVGVRG